MGRHSSTYKTAPCTDMASYGPAIFTPDELEEAPAGSVFIDECMDAYVKSGRGEWTLLREDHDGDPGACYDIGAPLVGAHEEMGVLVVKEKP